MAKSWECLLAGISQDFLAGLSGNGIAMRILDNRTLRVREKLADMFRPVRRIYDADVADLQDGRSRYA